MRNTFLRPLCLVLLACLVGGVSPSFSQSPIYFSSGDYANPNTYTQGSAALMGTIVGTNIHTTTPNGTGLKYFRFYSALTAGTIYEPNGASDILLTANTSTALQVTGSGKAYYFNIANAASNVVFKTNGSGTPGSSKVVAFEVQGAIQSVATVTQSPVATNVVGGNAVTINATLTNSLATGQGVYLRYSKDGFVTSAIVQLTGSGTAYSAIIPASYNTTTTPATVVSYYVFTSGNTGPAANGSDADLFTINLNNNGGSNYSYTVNDPSVIWTNPITLANPSASNPYTTGQTSNSNITVSGIGRGSGIAGVSAGNRYNANGWSTGAIDLNDYFYFTLTPNAGTKINFTNFVYTGQASAGTPTFEIRSSIDGFASNLGTVTATGATIDLSSANFQSITTAITFRFYGYGFALATTTYSINDFTFNGTVSAICTQAIITTNPSPQTVCTNATANFTAASSTLGVSYQWQLSANGTSGWTDILANGTPAGTTYTNANTATLSVVSTAAISQYFYRCKVITLSGCDAFTTAAKLIVNTPPAATAPSNPAAVCGSYTGSLAANITAGTNLLYQWQYSADGATGWANVADNTPNTGVAYTNATTATLGIAGLTQTGYYQLLITNSGCTGATVGPVKVTVNALPANPPNPTADANPACTSTQLNVTAAPSSADYFWQGTTNNGQTTTSNAALPYTANVAGTNTYYVTTRDKTSLCWSASSGSLSVTINTPIVITVDYPSSISVVSPNGTSFTLSGGITGTVTSYLWEVSDDAGLTWGNPTAAVYSGANTITLSISNTTGLNGLLYRCTVTGPCGTVVSGSATLTVNDPAYLWYNPITGSDPGLAAGGYTTNQLLAGNLIVSGISKGTGITGEQATNRYNASGWNSTFDANDYFEFTLTPNSGYKIDFTNFVYTSQTSTTNPPNSFAIKSSVDGYTSILFSPPSTGGTFSLTGTAFQGITYAITFRIYAWGGSNAGATFSINDFTFNGKVTSVCTLPAVPVANTNTSPQTSNVGSNAFAANWASISGTTGYSLDVSLYPTFATSGGNASTLFFSEYVEGSSNNKYLEIYNGTGASVNLAGYELRVYSNGSATPSLTSALSGTLANGQVIVLKNTGATVYGGTATVLPAVAFNGNDAIVLYNTGTSSFVDIIGNIGENPGTAWTASGLSTLDKTLVRNASVTSGVSVDPASGFPTLATQWTQFNQDDVSNLGTHTFSGASVQSFVAGYNGLAVSGGTITAQVVSGLNATTDYYYRIRSVNACGSSSNSNVVKVTTLDYTTADFRSRQPGNYTDFNTWQYFDGSGWVNAATGQLPGSGNNVNVRSGHTVTVNADQTVGSNKTLTVESGGIIAFPAGNIVSGTGNFTVASGGTLQTANANGITSGTTTSGSVQVTGTRTYDAGANYVYNGSGNQVTGAGLPTPLTGAFTVANTGTAPTNVVTLSQATTLAGTVNLTSGSFDLNTLTLTVSNGSATQSIAGSGTNTFTITGAAGSTLSLTGTATTHLIALSGFGTSSGTGLITGPNVNVLLGTNAQLDCGGTSTITSLLTVQGTFTITSGSSSNISNSHPPFYTSTSTLVYKVGYNVFDEWRSGTALTTTGVPQNVTIDATSGTVTMPTTDRSVIGNLTITNGTLALNTTSGDLYVGGNWTRASTATFANNNRLVSFNGSQNQTIQVSGGGSENFGYLAVAKSGGTSLILSGSPNATNVNVYGGTTNGTATLRLQDGVLDLNGQQFNFNLSSGTGNNNNIGIDGATGNLTRLVTSTNGTGTFSIGHSDGSNHTGSVVRLNGSGSNPATLLSFSSSVDVWVGTAPTFNFNSGINFGSGLTTINGKLVLQRFGFVSANAPTYANNSTLVYNTGGVYVAASEWTAVATTGAGVPFNVKVNDIGLSSGLQLSNAAYTVRNNFELANLGGVFTMDAAGGTLNIGGNWINNNIITTSNFTSGAGTVVFNGGTAQTIGGSNSSSNGYKFSSLTINNSNGVTLNRPITTAGTLTFSTGNINTDNTNILSVTNTAGTAVSGGSTSSFVNGPLTRSLVDAAGTSYNFPVGDGTVYLPFGVTTQAGTSPVLTVKATNSDAGAGTSFDANAITGLSTSEFWTVTKTGTFNGGLVSLTRQAALGTLNAVARSNAQTGSYSSLAGTVAATTITSTTATGANVGYYVLATALPSPTITSANATTLIGTQANSTGYFGQEITISGTNFASNATVKFNGTDAFSVSYVSATTLKAVVNTGTTSGTILVTNPTSGNNVTSSFSFSILGYITRAASDWNTATTWLGGDLPISNPIPAASSIVTINNGPVTINGTVANAPNTVTLTSAGGLTFGASGTLTVNNTLTNGGSILMTSGGVLTMAGGSTLANGTSTFTGGLGEVVFAAGANSAVTGTISFNNVTTATGVDFGTGSTITGTFKINGGGFVNTNPPKYGAASTLLYTGSYSRNAEWKAVGVGIIGTTPGYPNNVTISTGTFDIYNSASGVARALAGTLTVNNTAIVNFGAMNATFTAGNGIAVNNGGTINMNTMSGTVNVTGDLNVAGTVNMNSMSQAIAVTGDVNLTGSLTMSSVAGGDIALKGNWINNGTGANFNPNGRAVFFTGAVAQSIQGSNPTLFDFPFLIINNTSGGVSLSHPVVVSNTITLTSGVVTTTSTNSLSITNTASGAVASGSSASYINGPLNRSMVNSTNYVFPVGDGGTYLPFSVTTQPTGNTGAALTVQATNADAGGTFETNGLTALSATEFWTVTKSGTFNGGLVALTRQAALSGLNAVARSATKTGIYSTLGGTAAATTITSTTATAANVDYYVMATALPNPTITSVVATTPLVSQGNDNGFYGQEIKITGTNFPTNASLSVSFNGTNAFSFNRNSATEIVAVVALGTVTTGNLVVTNTTTSGAAQRAFSVLGYITRANGDWNDNGLNTTWLGSEYAGFPDARPTAGAAVTINNAVTVNGTVSNSPNTITIVATKSLTFGASGILTVNNTLTNAGTVTMTLGGTLNMGGNATLANTGTFTGGTGLVNFTGILSTTAQVTGTIAFNNITSSGGINFVNNTTINGIFTLTNAAFVTKSPTYATGSTLKYATGNNFLRNVEWNSPHHVQVSPNPNNSLNTTLVGGGNGANIATAFTIAGNLTIDANNTLTMSGPDMTSSLVIGGNLSLAGSLVGSGTSGADIKIAGNWNQTGTFTSNDRAVFFEGAADATITTNGSMPNVFIGKGSSNKVTLNSSLTVTKRLNLGGGKLVTTATNFVHVTQPNFNATEGITGGTSTSFIDGPARWSLPTPSALTFNFPVGKGSTYLPIALSNLTGGASPVVTAEAFTITPPNASNVDNTTVTNLSTGEHWTTVLNSGALTSAQVSVTAGSVTSNSVIAYSVDGGASATTKYKSVGGTVTGSSINNSTAVAAVPGTFAVGISCPKLDFSYSASAYCNSAGTITPTFASGSAAGVFSASPSIAGLNTSTGAIDVTGLAAGDYTIRNTAKSGSGCTNFVEITITINPNTAISGQPSSYNVCAGGTATALSVTATGTGTLTYQWYSNTSNSNSGGTALTGQTTASYTPSVTTAGTYYYYVIVGSGCGSNVTSTVATVTVNPNTAISGQPSGYSVCADGTATALSVTASGTGTLTYQWYSNTSNSNSGGTPLSGQTSASYTPSVATAGTYYYYVIVGSGCGSNVTSNAVTVTVNPNTAISGQPSGYSVCAGGVATALSVTATGTGTLTYQWYSNTINSNSGGTALTGETNASYTPPVTTAGTYYYYVIVGSGCGSNVNSNAVTVTVNPNTAISGQPTGYSVCAGGTATALSVTASGTGTLSYQWYSNISNSNSGGTALTGQTAASYTPSVTTAGTYYYYVIVGSGCGSNVTSNAATVTVNPNTAISGQPSGYSVCAGGTATALSVTATGTGTLIYQWYSNSANNNTTGTAISGQTAASYTPSVTTAGTYYYYVIVGNGCGSNVTSNVAVLTVNPNTAISGQPSGYSICDGGTATALSVTATGTGTLSYQWYSNTSNSNSGGTSLTGQTAASYTPSVTTAGTYYYYVIVGSGCGSNVTSNAVTVSVNPNTAITGQPSGYSVCDGGTATALSVTATGTGTLSYQWYSNTSNSNSGGTSLTGQTAASYTPSITTAGTYYYYVIVGSGCGSNVTSNAVTVSVNPNTAITGQPTGYSVCAGGTATALNVTAIGTGTLTYQWYSNSSNSNSGGTVLSGQTAASYTPSVTTAGTYYYYVIVGSSCGTATSIVAMVTVNPLPAIPTIGTITQPTCTVATGSFTITNFNASYTYTFSPVGPTVNGSGVVAAAAGTYSFTATLGVCTSAALTNVTVNPQPSTPVITSVAATTPINTQGNNNGYYGQEITISGNSFAVGATVIINGTAAFNTVIQSAGVIKAVVPVGAVPSGNVVVTNPSGSCTAQTSFTVLGYITRTAGDWNTNTQNSTWLGSEYASFPDPRPVANATVTINDATTVNSNVASVPAIITITGTGSVTQAIATTLTTLSLVNNGSVTTAGTLTINGLSTNASGITVNSAGVLAIGGTMTNSGSLSINGTGIFRIDANGAIVTNTPTYAATSTLVYNTGSSFTRGSEWTSATLGAPGYPGNVTVQGGTTLNIGTHAIGLAKDLSLGAAGSAGSLTFIAGPTAFKVGGNVSIGSSSGTGTSTLTIIATGINNGIWLDGNWTRYPNGVFIPNEGRVSFTGIVDKLITVAGGGTESFYELQINKADLTTKANLILADGTSVVVNTVLRMRAGYIVTTQINKLTVNNPLFSSVSNGSESSYVKGPLTRKMPDAISYNEYKFFVGVGSDYLPFSVYNPGGSSAYITVEAFKNDVGPTATFDATAIADISHTEYWKATLLSGSLSAERVSLARSPLGTNNIIARSTDQNGSYVSLNGTVSGSTYPGNTITSIAATGTNFGYFVLATALPNPVITQVVATTPINSQGNDNGFFGQEIILTGSNFPSNATMTINGVVPFTYSFVNATTIKAVVSLTTPLTGNIIVNNPTTGGSGSRAFTVLGFASRASTDWGITSTWLGGDLLGFPDAVPTASFTVTVNNAVVVGAAVTNAPNTVTVVAGQSLNFTAAGVLTVNNTLTNNGTIDMAAGGSLNMGGSSTLANNGTFTGTAGVVNFTGNNVTTAFITGTGALGSVSTTGGVNFVNNAPINGTFTLNGTGSVITNPPTYATGSTLAYNTATNFTAGAEWKAGATTGAGVPHHVQVGAGTANSGLTMPNGAYTSKGNFTLTNLTGATFTMNVSGGTFNLGGNWVNDNSTANFNAGGGTVVFNGGVAQTIGGNNTNTAAYQFNNITLNNAAGLSLSRPVTTSTSGVVTLTNGKLTTSATDILQVNNTATTAIAGGSLGTFINGPVKWSIANTASLLYTFPVGANNAYLPFALNSQGANGIVLRVQAFDTLAPNNTNVDSLTVSSLPHSEHWTASATGAGFTGARVSVTSMSNVPAGSVIAQSVNPVPPSATPYFSVNGSVVGKSINNSDPVDPNLGTFAIGIACPQLDFSYVGSPFCYNGGTVSPVQTFNGSTNKFTAGPGLSINENTGAINLGTSIPGPYTVRNTATTTCTNFVEFPIVINADITWTGIVDNDWNKPGNWSCNTIPGIYSNVVIANSGTKPQPQLVIGASGVANNLTLNNGTLLIVESNELQIKGTLSTIGGTITATQGKVTFNGAAAQTIPGSVFTGNNIKDLVIDNEANVSLVDSLNIIGGTNAGSLTVIKGVFITNNHLTIKSDANGTGRIAENSTGTPYLTGNVMVERYVPVNARRAYRLLAPSVTSTGSIRDNWQEGVNVEGANVNVTMPDYNPRPGYGTHITGSQSGANGFDATLTGNPSLFTLNAAGTAWVTVPNTDKLTLKADTGYLLFIRGDRTRTNIMSNTNFSVPTVLRAKGTIAMGNIITSGLANGKFSLVANPYAAPINWATIHNDNPNLEPTYYYYEAKLGSRGAYVSVNKTGQSNILTPYSADSSFGPQQPTVQIPSGMAFFVKSTGATSITIKESHKSVNNNAPVFRSLPRLYTALRFRADNMVFTADGVSTLFDDQYAAGIDGFDSPDLSGFDENVAILRNGQKLSIEARPSVVRADTIPLFIGGMKPQAYQWKFDAFDFGGGTSAYLVDKFLARNTTISLLDTTVIPFTVTSVAASSASDRFYIVLNPATVLPVTFTRVSAEKVNTTNRIDWKLATEAGMVRYEVERSADGRQFKGVGSVAAIVNNNGIQTYQLIDQSPLPGTNYYRIKAIDREGKFTYSVIVQVKQGNAPATMTVVPNPVTNHTLNLQMVNQPKGKYAVVMFTNLGQQLYRSEVTHLGGNSTFSLQLPNKLPAGIYQLQITNGVNSVVEKVVVE